MKRYVLCAAVVILPVGLSADARAAVPQDIVRHELRVTIEPGAGTLAVEDTITLPAAPPGGLRFNLHAGLAPVSMTPGVSLRKEGDRQGPAPLETYRVVLPRGVRTFRVSYGGEVAHPPEETGSEQARGFQSTPGIVSGEGVFLAGTSAWYPSFGEGLVTFRVETSVPQGWDSVSQGDRIGQEVREGRIVTTWDSPEPQEEIYLIAGPFTEFVKPAGRALAMAFLREGDSGLAGKYLDATARYLALYDSLIGPYPYRKFALVENFWETGFGMPSFALLGPSIIRLPFIINTSYPHEILHSWWGNSVFPDYASGNWSEGLTAYLADHLLKEQQGQGAEYRAATLQKYADYVLEGRDFPLTAFTSRHSSATEAVGYGKSLMVFHMLRHELGDRAFRAGLQELYRTKMFSDASWDDLRVSFEAASGKRLGREFGQWLHRTGAPELKLGGLSVDRGGGQSRATLRFSLRQEQPGKPYRLSVPVVVTLAGEKKAFQSTVTLVSREQTFSLEVPGRPVRIDIDPEFDLFRRLSRDETPPALTQALGSHKMLVLLPAAADAALVKAYQAFAEGISGAGPDEVTVSLDSEVRSLPADRAVVVLGWENRFLPQARESLAGYSVTLSAERVRIGKTSVPKKGHSFVLAGRSVRGEALLIVAADQAEALPGLGRKIPHYHKYSYLAFEGAEPANVAKGRWPVTSSPLTAVLSGKREAGRVEMGGLALRRPLAEALSDFSAERMMGTVNFLAGSELKGRGPGTQELDQAAKHIANAFREARLAPGGDDNGWYQEWIDGGTKKRMRNVIAVLPGRDPALADQSVVVGAHYDHLGMGTAGALAENRGKLHPGADDNASGVAVLLELAKVLAAGPAPARSIVFAAFTAEEAGKLGSKRYVAAGKRFPASKAVAMLNLDTIGRLEKRKLLVLGAGTAQEWPHIFRGAGFATGVDMELASEDLDAGDQKSFQDAGIPAVQLFSGPHLDYHRPSDTPDRIDADGLVKVAGVAKEIVEYLASREGPLSATLAPGAESDAGPKKERTVSLGTVPDFAFQGAGVRLSGVVPGSPAEKAGMREGDVVTRINANPVRKLKDLSDALKTLKSGDKASVTFLREGKDVKVEVEMKER